MNATAALSKRLQRPEIAINFALTWDARISTRGKTPATFSSPRDKARMLEIRASGDALLVGRGTLEADQMQMGLPNATLRAGRLAAGRAELPLRVIASHSGAIDPTLPVFNTPGAPIVIFTTEQMPPATRVAVEAKGATVHPTPGQQVDRVDLPAMLDRLARQYGVRRLICEGGPTLLRSLLEAGCVDEVNLTFCPRLFGGEEAATLTGLPGAFLPHALEYRMEAMEVIDGECYLRYSAKKVPRKVRAHTAPDL